MTKLEDLRPTPGSVKPRKRVGRGIGSGHGKTSGRGHKGQKSRGSGKVHMWLEGGQTPLHRRLPKVGFKSFTHKNYAIVNIRLLEEKFSANDEITPELLLEKGFIKKIKDGVKILGSGELTKPLIVKAHAFSNSAKKAIEMVGGKVEVI
ncbi:MULTISPECIES: 50S ribosomal protein L15 [Pseudothermotoga]|jgi:large subunit ribosomal protein L15|uniref:Large ribosomal subunit protein uL15 n=1 Tax=Pseudothermotoga lettingae (strain ATCC BAA-301 / DSM 14385 / NBRC 107922 / TMO) TaxID=416591 RepID=RL15_PSELT|nr:MULTISPECIES: 50S ribosomal protein L15 [Pseudothermotoga]A8F4T0.1 RecName: Full=Large ribosomal subunit protein uL15; AltName: Full=50S ribosomal protein L15 [Pseudothermotoga lettingae TMO]ABV33164.1 ribosomal protein L15 [Pseudothermotoga lettingae TMO]KUK21655.1 MAG: 50S ribosomal protein L15 [Pseudothermotoga lettingae]MDI3494431.1 large subunit ribosomal protein [Pseudothermotoga sp.]MDK2884170.1 large subunit ribosomal protein [Pseudothermotoga sp.]GLI47834.1 50S ribosomal protein L